MFDQLQLSLPSGRGVGIYPPGATFGPRLMRDYEFVWMLEGHAQYRWHETTVEAPEGSIVLCRPTTQVKGADFFRWDPDKRTRHAFFHFDVLSLPPHWPPPDHWPLVRVPVEGDVLRPLFRHLLTWVKNRPAAAENAPAIESHAGTAPPANDPFYSVAHHDELLCRLTMAHMLTAFVSGELAASDAPPDVLPEAVERTLRYIQETLEEDPARAIDLPDLARAAFVTPEHLCRVFKSATGRTPVETVRLARLDRSVTLLARSNYAIGEIAHLCGFASAFHFSRRFKEAFGDSPREIRKRIGGGEIPPLPRLLRWAPTLRYRATKRF